MGKRAKTIKNALVRLRSLHVGRYLKPGKYLSSKSSLYSPSLDASVPQPLPAKLSVGGVALIKGSPPLSTGSPTSGEHCGPGSAPTSESDPTNPPMHENPIPSEVPHIEDLQVQRERFRKTVHRLGSAHVSSGPQTVTGESGTSGIPNEKDFNATTCWIAADKALLHVRSKASDFANAFSRKNIPPSEYAVHAGFDESRIRADVGYIEQVHIFVSKKVKPSDNLLSELERICLPFSGMLFMESSSYAVSLPNGIRLDYRNIPPPTVIRLAQTPSAVGGPTQVSSENGQKVGSVKQNGIKGEKRDDAASDDVDEEDGTDKAHPKRAGHGSDSTNDPSIAFAVRSTIPFTSDGRDAIQTVTMRGGLTIATTSLAEDTHNRRIQFDTLQFGTNDSEEEMPYKHSHIKVIVDAHALVAHPTFLFPMSTSAHWKTNQTSYTTDTRGHTESIGGIVPTGSLQYTHTNTPAAAQRTSARQFASRIAQKDDFGTSTWRFEIDDTFTNKGGIDMDADALPWVDFLSVNPTALSHGAGIEITSCWSLNVHSCCPMGVSRKPKNLFQFFKSEDGTMTPSYSNLCQITCLRIHLPALQPSSQANVDAIREATGDSTVSTPQGLQGTESLGVVTPTIDSTNLNVLKFPFITKVKLPDNHAA